MYQARRLGEKYKINASKNIAEETTHRQAVNYKSYKIIIINENLL